LAFLPTSLRMSMRKGLAEDAGTVYQL
jgi:hypothetical protein